MNALSTLNTWSHQDGYSPRHGIYGPSHCNREVHERAQIHDASRHVLRNSYNWLYEVVSTLWMVNASESYFAGMIWFWQTCQHMASICIYIHISPTLMRCSRTMVWMMTVLQSQCSTYKYGPIAWVSLTPYLPCSEAGIWIQVTASNAVVVNRPTICGNCLCTA